MYRRHPVGPCRRETGAPSESNSARRRAAHPPSLARRQDMLSTRKSANFLPVGKDFTIPARYFLPVGMGLQSSPAKATKRHNGRRRRTQPWSGRYPSKCPAWRDPRRLLNTPWRLRRTYSLLEVRVRGRTQSPIWRHSQVITSRHGNFPDAGESGVAILRVGRYGHVKRALPPNGAVIDRPNDSSK